MKKWTSLVFAAVLFGVLPSCGVDAEMRVDAKRYLAIADAHRAYVMADPNLLPQQRQDRLDLLLAWKNSFPPGYLVKTPPPVESRPVGTETTR